jgi:MYXO-CTERM domain-containing protein
VVGKRATAFALAGLSLVAVAASPRDAAACGGLFCNGGPPNPFAPLPVAQNGENVVFAITKDPAGGAPTLEAHIQILYTGDAAKFSWVVPVDAVPTLGTGTDLLFSMLSAVTTPNFIPTFQTLGSCRPNPQQVFDAGAFPTMTTGAGGAVGAGPGNVQVAFQGVVGPFDAAVIKSDDPLALKKWLTDNAYVVTDQASGLIDTYVHENKYFVALKLLNGVGVKQIQPITLKFRGVEACVPLRLTAIAANPDMPVLVFVLGDTRVAPRGFHELQIDDAAINWPAYGSNYFGATGLVSKAANEAGGKAFVTEYAGSSQIANARVYRNGQFDVNALKGAMTPPAYVQQLTQMGLASDPLMLGLLTKYIPMPDAVKKMNIPDFTFYGNLSQYWNQFAFPPFDLAGLTDAITTSIITPRMNAQMMIDGHPMLTRLNTFISPDEMDADPFFFETQDLPNVSNTHTATIQVLCGDDEYLACNAPSQVVLADGRKIWLNRGSKASTCTSSSNGYPTLLASLPATTLAWDREIMGDGQIVLDNRTKIATALDGYNATAAPAGVSPDGGASPDGSAGGGGNFGSGGFGGAFAGHGGGGSGGNWGPAATGSHGNDACGCNAGAGSPGGALGVGAGVLGLALARRRRRARR